MWMVHVGCTPGVVFGKKKMSGGRNYINAHQHRHVTQPIVFVWVFFRSLVLCLFALLSPLQEKKNCRSEFCESIVLLLNNGKVLALYSSGEEEE